MNYERLNIQDFVDKWDVAKVQHLEDGIVANEEAIERYHNDSVVEMQADWEQSDETAKDYVKNRTHYKETKTYSIANNFETTYNERYYEGDEVSRYLEPNNFSCNLSMEGKESTSLKVFVNGESIKVVDYFVDAYQAYWNLENNLRISYSSYGPKGESSEPQFSWRVMLLDGFEAVDGQKFNLTVTVDGVTYVPIDEKYMPKSVLEWQQPVDWNCNDVNDPTYVKNRTHYDYWAQGNKIYDYENFEDKGTLPYTFQVTAEGGDWLGGHGFMYNGCLFNGDSNWEIIGEEYDETLEIWKMKRKCQQTQTRYENEETLTINATSYSQHVPEKVEWVDFITIDCEYKGPWGIQLYEAEIRSKTLDKRFLADFSVEKDWNINDSTNPRYIENRTHYAYLGQGEGLLFVEYDTNWYDGYNLLPYTQVIQSDLVKTECPGYWLGREAGYWINIGDPNNPASYLLDAYSDWKKIGEEDNIIIYQCQHETEYPCTLTVAVQPVEGSSNEYKVELRSATFYGDAHYGVKTAKKTYKTLDIEYLPDGLPNDIDWNESNETSRSYIRNRPCYEKEVVYTTIFDSTITESPYQIDSQLLDSKSTFRIICSDTEEITETKAYSWKEESGDEGYYLITTPSVEIKTNWYRSEGGFTTITIKEGFEVPYNVMIQMMVEPAMIKQLDEKFIPDTIARKVDIENITFPVTSVNGQTGDVDITNDLNALDSKLDALDSKLDALKWSDLGETITEDQLVYANDENIGIILNNGQPGIEGTKLSIGDTCRVNTGGILAMVWEEEFTAIVDENYSLRSSNSSYSITYNSLDNTYTVSDGTSEQETLPGTILITKLASSTINIIDEKYIPDTIARAPKATLNYVTEAPTAEQYNALLDILKEAGILV